MSEAKTEIKYTETWLPPEYLQWLLLPNFRTPNECKFSITEIDEILSNGCNLYVVDSDALSENLKNYNNNSYIYLKNTNQINYITPNGKLQKFTIKDKEVFQKQLLELNPNQENFVYLPIEQLTKLIKLNEESAPPNPQEQVQTDLPRKAWALGNVESRSGFGKKEDGPQSTIDEMVLVSQKNGVNLSEQEAKALCAFAVCNEKLGAAQEGFFYFPAIVTNLLFTPGVLYELASEKKSYVEVVRNPKDQSLDLCFHLSYYNSAEQKKLVFQHENHYKLIQNQDQFTLTRMSEVKDCTTYIAEDFLNQCLEQISESHLQPENLKNFIPFLTNKFFAKAFVEKLSQADINAQTLQEVVESITVYFKNFPFQYKWKVGVTAALLVLLAVAAIALFATYGAPVLAAAAGGVLALSAISFVVSAITAAVGVIAGDYLDKKIGPQSHLQGCFKEIEEIKELKNKCTEDNPPVNRFANPPPDSHVTANQSNKSLTQEQKSNLKYESKDKGTSEFNTEDSTPTPPSTPRPGPT